MRSTTVSELLALRNICTAGGDVVSCVALLSLEVTPMVPCITRWLALFAPISNFFTLDIFSTNIYKYSSTIVHTLFMCQFSIICCGYYLYVFPSVRWFMWACQYTCKLENLIFPFTHKKAFVSRSCCCCCWVRQSVSQLALFIWPFDCRLFSVFFCIYLRIVVLCFCCFVFVVLFVVANLLLICSYFSDLGMVAVVYGANEYKCVSLAVILCIQQIWSS